MVRSAAGRNGNERVQRRYGRRVQPKPRSRSGLPLLWGVILVGLAGWTLLARNQEARAPQSAPDGVATAVAPTVLAGPRGPARVAPTSAPAPLLHLPDHSAEAIDIALRLDSAFNAGDVQASLALFDSTAEVKVPPDLYRGSAQILSWLSYLAANHFATEPGLRRVAGHTVTWPAEVRSDHLARLGLSTLAGDATMVVHGTMVTAYTFVLSAESASRLRAAQLAAADVLQDPLVVGVDSANVYGPDDVFRTADGQLVSYRDVVGTDPGAGPFFDLGGQPIAIRMGL